MRVGKIDKHSNNATYPKIADIPARLAIHQLRRSAVCGFARNFYFRRCSRRRSSERILEITDHPGLAIRLPVKEENISERKVGALAKLFRTQTTSMTNWWWSPFDWLTLKSVNGGRGCGARRNERLWADCDSFELESTWSTPGLYRFRHQGADTVLQCNGETDRSNFVTLARENWTCVREPAKAMTQGRVGQVANGSVLPRNSDGITRNIFNCNPLFR